MAEVEVMAHEDEDAAEGRLIENPDIQALVHLNSAEINQQIMTAHAYPRSPTLFRKTITEMVTYDQATALACLYALKRGKKIIEGASIRFAEAAIASWKNSRAGARIVDIGEQFVTAQGFFYDLETNMALAFEVMRRITDSDGRRYNEDMIGVTSNAALSIAFRNVVLRGIPKIYWNAPYQEARALSVGKGTSINDKRNNMVAAFAPLGVDEQQILGLLGVKGLLDVSVEQLMFMAGILNSIKEGEAKVEEVFAVENMEHPDQVRPGARGGKGGSNPFERQGGGGGAAGEKGPGVSRGTGGGGGPAPAVGGQPGSGGAGGAAIDQTMPADTAPVSEQRELLAEAMREDARAFIREAYDDLAAITKVRDIPGLQERVLAAGVMDEAQEKKWNADCDSRAKEIMDAAKRKK